MKERYSFFEFLEKCKTPYHTVNTIKETLIENGFTELSEKDSDSFSDGGEHFVIRAGSIIAFRGSVDKGGFAVVASHSDTPAFKVKGVSLSAGYTRLSVEPYGGMINYSWLDRPLSLAGRAIVNEGGALSARVFDIDRDLVTIPSVAIHFNRGVNDGVKLNPAIDMLPLFGVADEVELNSLIADSLSVQKEQIADADIYLYNRARPTSLGKEGELILSPRLDNIASVYASTVAFLSAKREGVSVLSVFDNEEVGSSTRHGAASDFLYDTLYAIAGDRKKYKRAVCDGFAVSCDNAHARHPNHPEMSDALDAPILGGGVAIKYNANQRYTTDGLSASVFRALASRIGEKTQRYSNRADMPGGSTLGSISNTKVSILTVDVGVPQLAMHSATETCHAADVDSLAKILGELYSVNITASSKKVEIEN